MLRCCKAQALDERLQIAASIVHAGMQSGSTETFRPEICQARLVGVLFCFWSLLLVWLHMEYTCAVLHASHLFSCYHIWWFWPWKVWRCIRACCHVVWGKLQLIGKGLICTFCSHGIALITGSTKQSECCSPWDRTQWLISLIVSTQNLIADSEFPFHGSLGHPWQPMSSAAFCWSEHLAHATQQICKQYGLKILRIHKITQYGTPCACQVASVDDKSVAFTW